MANNFFNDSNKAYSENLNDSILVGNAFDWTVDISLPTDTGSVFPNSSTVVKAKVADVSITPNSNLSIGSSIENSSGSSQVYRLTVYPNFNRFGGFKSITLEGDGTFYIANKGANAPIANNLDYDNLGNVPELKVLKEYDIVITIPSNKEVTGLEFVFQSSSADVSGSINQSNVTGLTDDLSSLESGKADTVHSHNSSQVRESNALPHIGTNARANQSGINGAVDNKIGSLSTSITNLIQVQNVSTSFSSCQPSYSIDRTATVTACPSGYSHLFIPQNSYRSVTRFVSLNGTTASFQVTNINNSTQEVSAKGWLIYYPSNFNI